MPVMEATQTAATLRALARAAAVLGDGTPVAAAAQLAELDVEAAERGADALATAGILASGRPLRFAHPIARAAIYASMAPGERAIAHRRAVRVLAGIGAAPMAVVAHVCAVEPAGDPFVVDGLIAAGRSALAAGAPRQAAVLLERALAEPPTPGARAEARRLLAHSLTLMGDPRAPALACHVLGAASLHERSRLAGVLVDALWLTGRAEAAASVAREVAGGDPPGVAAARAARDGVAAAEQVVSWARRGAHAVTAFERCLAIAALIACDELVAARAEIDRCTRVATACGASAELGMLARLRARLRAVQGAVLDGTGLLPGPDPGPSPWRGWLDNAAAVERFGTPSTLAAALLDSRDIESLEHAVAILRESPRRPMLGQALLELGRALRHAGRRRAARGALTEALALAQHLNAVELGAHAREELRLAGARPRRHMLSGPPSLTPAERRVADEAAAGWSNREIAARLFLSPKTVEMHLGRVYRKLDIRSRTELPSALPEPLAAAA